MYVTSTDVLVAFDNVTPEVNPCVHTFSSVNVINAGFVDTPSDILFVPGALVVYDSVEPPLQTLFSPSGAVFKSPAALIRGC